MCLLCSSSWRALLFTWTLSSMHYSTQYACAGMHARIKSCMKGCHYKNYSTLYIVLYSTIHASQAYMFPVHCNAHPSNCIRVVSMCSHGMYVHCRGPELDSTASRSIQRPHRSATAAAGSGCRPASTDIHSSSSSCYPLSINIHWRYRPAPGSAAAAVGRRHAAAFMRL
jgi:hypothetical protein